MTQAQHTTLIGTKTSPLDLYRWTQTLMKLHARLAPRFARPEPRRRALAYVQGILSDTARKNGWQLAEYVGEVRPDGMQRLLSTAVWESNGVRNDLRSYALEQLGREAAILAIDETSFPKRGKKSAGVGMQYCGTTGSVENCQVGVFLSYITARGHTLIDRELYLPLDWIEDRPRCLEAGIPEPLRFQTKPELARCMLARVHEAQIPIAWVVADSVYGSNLDLRTWLEAHHDPYVLAVTSAEPVGLQTAEGRRRVVVTEVEALLVQDHLWQRLSMSEGTKGPRFFDWACVPILHHWADDGRHWLLIRRDCLDPQEKRYYLVFAPAETPLSAMVKAIGCRWRIEEDFETAKAMGLDHYEVRSFAGWYRHITLVLVALVYLVGICVTERKAAFSFPSTSQPVVLPLTVSEVRHLLAQLTRPMPTTLQQALAWSWWRRCHQSWASYFHTKRRLKRLMVG